MEGEGRDLTLKWSGRISLTARILALNIFALALLAGGFFYLDSYRTRILDNRTAQASREVRLIAAAMVSTPADHRNDLALRLARDTDTRIRLFAADGTPIADTRAMGLRNFVLVDPNKEGWGLQAARFLDAIIDTVVNAPRAPLYRERKAGSEWPDVRTARTTKGAPATVWRAPDRTPVITAAAGLGDGEVVMTTVNARDVTQTVRLERFRLGVVLAIVTTVSIFLSLFGADDRAAVAPAGAGRGSRPAGACARGRRPAAAVAPRRDRQPRPRAQRHEPCAAGADRRHRSLRRRRHA